MTALDELIALDPIEEARGLGEVLFDALVATDLLGRHHVRLEAGVEAASRRFSEIADRAMTPEEAIRFISEQQSILPEAFETMTKEYRARAFTVAGIERMDVLEKVKGLLIDFLADDRGLEAFQTELNALIENAGLLPLKPHHVESIFRTNMQTAYNAGRWAEIMSPEMEPFFPLLEYHNPRDERSRKAHAKMGRPGHNRYRRDDPIWKIWWPPNGHQ